MYDSNCTFPKIFLLSGSSVIKHQEPFEIVLMVFSMWNSQIYPVVCWEVVLLQAIAQEGLFNLMPLQINIGNMLTTCLKSQHLKAYNVCSNSKIISFETTYSDQ